MGDAQQAERAGFARQLMAVGRFAQRRMEQMSGEHDFWCVDDWEAIAAEFGAELGISRGRAASQMRYGTTLLERFPKLGEVFLAGRVDFRVIAATIFRTDLIADKDVLAKIDAELAAKAPSWNKLSREKVTELVDWMVIEADPDAVRLARQRDLDRHIEVQPGQNGMAEIWGSVRAPDAAAFAMKLNELAATVCAYDARTKTPRRYPTSPTPCPTHPARLIRRTTSCTAGSITCSKPFTPGLRAGPRFRYPTAPSSGPHPADAPTPPNRSVRCSSPNWASPQALSSCPARDHRIPIADWRCPSENAPEPRTAPTGCSGNAASIGPATPPIHHPSRARRSASRRSPTGRGARAHRARTGPNPRRTCRPLCRPRDRRGR